MKMIATLEIIEQSDKVSLYSISFEKDGTTEFERYFRPEGTIKDGLCALPLESGKIRLYCLRLSDQILIIGNGGIKQTRTYQDKKSLLGYVMDLQKFDALLKNEINDGSISIEEKVITGIEDKVFKI